MGEQVFICLNGLPFEVNNNNNNMSSYVCMYNWTEGGWGLGPGVWPHFLNFIKTKHILKNGKIYLSLNHLGSKHSPSMSSRPGVKQLRGCIYFIPKCKRVVS